MSYIPVEIVPYVKYATPPVIGAFIGYLTNRIAIKMLFRPLKAWRVGGFRVPMTPGVIPSKRGELAQNMGEVVGDHLLTSSEVGKGLQRIVFQEHLHSLIQQRLEIILQKDLGNLASIVPMKFQAYFLIASKTVSYRVKGQVHSYIESDEFVSTIEKSLNQYIEGFLDLEVSAFLTNVQRDNIYSFIEESITRMFESSAMEEWVQDFIREKVSSVLQQEKTFSDVLPLSVQELWIKAIEKQTPALLEKLGNLVSEPKVRDQIVSGSCAGVAAFIESLGSMSDMVRGFLPMATVEVKIREYLIEKDDDIVAWLQSEDLQQRVVAVLRERSSAYLEKPISSFFSNENPEAVDDFCNQSANHILALIRTKEVSSTLTSMIKANVETNIKSGSVELRQVIEQFIGGEALLSGKNWFRAELKSFLKSPKTIGGLDKMIDALIEGLLHKKIGKIANIVPAGVKDGIAGSVQKTVSVMLADEVPGLVQSLNIRKIVTEKVNSLDILQVEGLLLTIMEEQFKYINLFGALLGFLIGCLNLVFLYVV